MASGQSGAVLKPFQTLFSVGTLGDLTDGQLLAMFLDRRGEAAEQAFTALVERHGPMVLRACRQVLDDPNDAQDAFQATFLVLARKAGSIRKHDSIGSWLYGVAGRVAARSRRGMARRRAREQRGAAMSAATRIVEGGPQDSWPELHEELGRLPEKYRAPVVLCYLEGRTHEEAARQLQWPVGTVKIRLTRARDLLRDRLTRRGLALPAGLLAAGIGAPTASAAIPAALLQPTVQAAIQFAAGQATAGMVPASVAALTEGVLTAMFLNRLKTIAMATLAATLAIGGGMTAYRASFAANLPNQDATTPAVVAIAAPPGDDARPLASNQASPKVRLQPVKPGSILAIEALEGLPGRPLNGLRLVRPDGTVSLGYYGDLYVEGLNRDEIKVKVVKHLRKFLTDEVLGLVEYDAGTGAPTKIAPAESNRVYIDDHPLRPSFEEPLAIVTGLNKSKAPKTGAGPTARAASVAAPDVPRHVATEESAKVRLQPVKPGSVVLIEVLQALPGRPIAGERVVRPDGTLTLGFYGDLYVEGLTRDEIKAKVVEKLRRHLNDEMLGLVETDPRTGAERKVAPAESNRVYVDDSTGVRNIPDSRFDELERKVDRILDELDALKSKLKQ